MGFDVKFWLVSQTQGILEEPESLSLSLRLGNFSLVVFTVILRKELEISRYTISRYGYYPYVSCLLLQKNG